MPTPKSASKPGTNNIKIQIEGAGIFNNCGVDFLEFMYGKKHETKPYITDDNLFYKFFLIELLIIQNTGTPGFYDPLVLETIYQTMDDILQFVKENGSERKSCISLFEKLYESTNVSEKLGSKINYNGGKIWMATGNNGRSEQKIKRFPTSTFTDFLERFSKSLSALIPKDHSQVIKAVEKEGVVLDAQNIDSWGKYASVYAYYQNQISHFIMKARDNKFYMQVIEGR